MQELDSAIKCDLIERDMREWQELLYQAGIRHRVQKQLKAPRKVLEAIEKDMEHATRALDAYAAILAEIEGTPDDERPTADHPQSR